MMNEEGNGTPYEGSWEGPNAKHPARSGKAKGGGGGTPALQSEESERHVERHLCERGAE